MTSSESHNRPSLGDIDAQLLEIIGDHVDRRAKTLRELGAPSNIKAWKVQPASEHEVSKLVQLAGAHDIAIIPVGVGRRAPKQDNLGDRPRLFVELQRMCHVLRIDEQSLTVQAQSGITGDALTKALKTRGLSLGDLPPATLRSTLGGMLAVRTPGKASPRHGFIENAVLSIHAVLADGRVIRTSDAPRSATGPNLNRVFCGSEGTLGIITSATFRLHPKPETRLLSAFMVPGFGGALAAVHLALRDEAAPSAIRVYDAEQAKRDFGSDNLPAQDISIIVCATAGPTDLAACDRELIESAVGAMGGTKVSDKLAEHWWTELRAQDDDSVQLVLSARPSRQVEVHDAVVEACAQEEIVASASIARFRPDGAVLFFSFRNRDGERCNCDGSPKWLQHAREAARGAGGFILGAQNAKFAGYLDALRKQLDPHGIMNPCALRHD